jgi:hypothetical protein
MIMFLYKNTTMSEPIQANHGPLAAGKLRSARFHGPRDWLKSPAQPDCVASDSMIMFLYKTATMPDQFKQTTARWPQGSYSPRDSTVSAIG